MSSPHGPSGPFRIGANKFRSMVQQAGILKIVDSPKRRLLKHMREHYPSLAMTQSDAEATAAGAGRVVRSLAARLPQGQSRAFWDGFRGMARRAIQVLEQRVDPASRPLYVDVVQNSFSAHYARYVPFERRWDGITASLAVLGKVSTGNAVVPFRDSAEAYKHMWGAVDKAERLVHWQTYICKDDAVGTRTVEKLIAAKKRGCDTELLYDCGGNISGRAKLTSSLKKSGASVIAYRPFFRSFVKYMARGFDWKRSPGLRNHRKILIVDGKVGFCGGLNIGNEYCGVAAGGSGKFRDSHVMVSGPAVKHLAMVYKDTTHPHPWKYGLTRFRQIASTRIQQQYTEGKEMVTEAFVEPVRLRGRNAVARSGTYVRRQLRKARVSTNGMMRWVDKMSIAPPCPAIDKPIVQDTPPSSPESHEGEKGSHNGANAERQNKEEHTQQQEQQKTEEEAGELDDKDRLQLHSNVANAATRRKVLEARANAVYNATAVPHRRAYTKLLQHMPIADTDPVPEAEGYSRLHPPTVQIVSSNPRYRDFSIQYAFWQVSRKCHRRLWITTPYYLPTRKLLRALLHAAGRGVDVRILAGGNRTTDPWWMWHASNHITRLLLHGGVKVYEFDGDQIMHAKTVVVDSIWSSVGSYNWDVLSNKNLEVCLFALDYQTAREMERQFLQDLALCKEVNLAGHLQRSWWQRFVSWFFYNAVYVLDRITFRDFSNADIEDRPGRF